ncbi:hypothetical protein CC80DRAFT_52949 [Byssothecium circinans]|uniref:CHAT domain-containing protein n=1 Tax=Byssothecium circinans TaxID=147558 RepID=A0A6A5U1U2_9PLEO|nr:hypothetical protein CC80DRAFT_52949 [Byssothecium circinans]
MAKHQHCQAPTEGVPVKHRPSLRDSKARDILEEGQKKEEQAERETSIRRRNCLLLDALQIYNCGCCASELYQKIQDSHDTSIWLFDRSDWANVFFSAARICTKFAKIPPLDKNGRPILPCHFQCKGQLLTSKDWKHQALYYLEQGRARSLLHSISSGSSVTDRERYVIWKTTREAGTSGTWDMDIRMRVVAEAALQSIKKRDSLIAAAAAPVSAPPTTEAPISDINKQVDDRRESPVSMLPSQESRPSTMAQSMSKSFTDPSSSVDLSQRMNATILAHMKVQIRWRKAILFARTKNPHIGDVLLGDIEEMRANIPSDTVVVEYALASTPPCGVMIIVATSDGIRLAEWNEVDAKEIHDCINNLHATMGFSRSKPGQSTRTAQRVGLGPSRSYVRPSDPQRIASAACQEKLSHVLDDAVVAPVRPHLVGKTKLIIIPSGELAHVPWTIFFDLPVTVVPSLNIWSRLQTQAASSEEVARPKISVVSNAPKDKEKERRNLPALRDIPYSRIEALCIARRHQEWPFIADEKSRDDFKSVAEGAHILHLCAHSTFNHKTPMSSSIQLFQEPLEISDWRELSIRADLVIFSSCVSGLSRAYASGSAVGFAHTLLATGTKTFIGSLWPVDDSATLLFMIMFYKELRKSLSPAEALYTTQKRMRTLTRDELGDLIAEVEEYASHDFQDEYVINPTYHIDELKKQNATELREERYWAAFVLTGYGAKELYPEDLEEE